MTRLLIIIMIMVAAGTASAANLCYDTLVCETDLHWQAGYHCHVDNGALDCTAKDKATLREIGWNVPMPAPAPPPAPAMRQTAPPAPGCNITLALSAQVHLHPPATLVHSGYSAIHCPNGVSVVAR